MMYAPPSPSSRTITAPEKTARICSVARSTAGFSTLRVVVRRDRDEPGVFVHGDRVVVADDVGLSVRQLLREHERQLDVDPLGDRRLLDLEAGGLRAGDLD